MLVRPIPHSSYHPVIHLPDEIEVYDFTQGYDPNRQLQTEYGAGRYNEHRPTMYTGDLFEQDARCVHIGIDIGCPRGTPIFIPSNGIIAYQGYNSEPFDYGHVIVTKHKHTTYEWIWILFGHLSKESIQRHSPQDSLKQGTTLGWVGPKSENGGWNPHLHIQISITDPKGHDMPGVVSLKERESAIVQYPDPRIVLGQIYP